MKFYRKRPHRVLQTLNVLLAVFLFSCGIEEYYYLPQVPESNIKRTSNTEAEISLPDIDDPKYYYASNYSIFYRIYISNNNTIAEIQTPTDRNNISSALANDFSALQPYTNPANSSITSANTFSSRNYFELEFDSVSEMLPKDGGTLRIQFPTGSGDPVVSLNDGPEIRLRRSSNLISPQPIGDLYFRNTQGLNDFANATSSINADVAGRDISPRYAYVSMYIVAVGYDDRQFTPIYSKPTLISIFKLPDTN